MPPSRVALLFSGGPAPAANAVIAAAATTLRRGGAEVIGLRHGYEALVAEGDAPLVAGRDWFVFEDRDLWGLRHRAGVVLGTSRAGPAAGIRTAADLDDPVRADGLRRTWQRLVDLGVDALVSIGGDGTLRTAHLLHAWQQRLPADAPRVAVVHVPKTIDNDYGGIDFTFGFFTAVDAYAAELRTLREDARATRRVYVAEVMGRRAGWLAYAAAVAGEAHLVLAREDVAGDLADGDRLDLDALVSRIAALVRVRAAKGKRYAVVVLAEGLVELLPRDLLAEAATGDRGELSLAQVQLSRLVAGRVQAALQDEGDDTRVVGVQLGYEARCAPPHAFDLLLGSQLGVGAARALAEGRDGVMVSIEGQLSLRWVPFTQLVDPETLETEVRYVPVDSDFHGLAKALETVVADG